MTLSYSIMTLQGRVLRGEIIRLRIFLFNVKLKKIIFKWQV